MDIDGSIAFWKSDPSEEQLGEAVEEWVSCLNGPQTQDSDQFGQHIVGMTFFAPADVQWRFILIAVARLEDEDHVAALAAGPLEGFLGRFGEVWIGRLETECRTNLKLRRVLENVWQHQMSDDVYRRVVALAASLDS